MTDEKLKALVTSNARSIQALTDFQNAEEKEWRDRIDRENTEWTAGGEIGKRIESLVSAVDLQRGAINDGFDSLGTVIANTMRK